MENIEGTNFYAAGAYHIKLRLERETNDYDKLLEKK